MSIYSTIHKFRYWFVVAGFPALIIAAMMLGVFQDCKGLPDAERQHRVSTDRTFEKSIETAMGILNRAAGCKIFIPGTPDDHSINFIGMTDTPCAVDPLHEGIESGHTANAYHCPGTGKWDIDVEAPGDIRLMVCIAAHELLHTIGLKDSKHGLMDQRNDCVGLIWPNDFETEHLKNQCKEETRIPSEG